MKQAPLSSAFERKPSADGRRRATFARFQNFRELFGTPEDTALLLLSISLFLHWTISVAVVLGVFIWVICSRKRLAAAVCPVGETYFLLLIFLGLFLVSLLRDNWMSLIGLSGIAVYVLTALWARSIMTRARFERFLDASLAMSFVSAVIGLLQILVNREDSDYLVVGPTTNANFYGIFLMMLILTAFYRLFRTGWKEHVLFYLFSVAVNFSMLLFTESVASLFGLVFGFLVLLFCYRHYRTFTVLTFGLFGLFALGIVLPGSPWNGSVLYPVLERMELWKIAWRSITENAANFLFGNGLFSFQKLWDQAPHSFWDVRGVVPRDFQPHAHNLYVELWLSAGLLGVLSIGAYTLRRMHVLHKRMQNAVLRPYSVLILVLFSAVLFSNLADVSVFWVQGGMWFMLVCASDGIGT